MIFQTLHNPIRWLFLAHALTGALALLIMLLPLISKKGGTTHVKTGWIYTFAMLFVGISAMILTPWRAFLDPERTDETIGNAVFLFFIAIFTLCVLSFGLVVLKHKNRKTQSRALTHLGPPTLLIVLAVSTQITGIILKSPLLMIFPFLGLVSAVKHLRYWSSPPTQKMHWWYAHMEGMLTACIATVTAFLVTALPRLWDHPFAHSIFFWLAPGVIGGFGMGKWLQRYQEQFKR